MQEISGNLVNSNLLEPAFGTPTSAPEYVSKGWGYELILVNNQQYCGKLLHFVANRRCSLHYHKQKHETFFLKKGSMSIYYFDDASLLEAMATNPTKRLKIYEIIEKTILHQGATFTVPPGRVHQMVAHENSELFEFSTQDFTEDSYRIIKGN